MYERNEDYRQQSNGDTSIDEYIQTYILIDKTHTDTSYSYKARHYYMNMNIEQISM
jgi:hypothetical protein